MSEKIVIFDFDGTIANSRDILVQIGNKLAVEFGYPTVSDEELFELSNLSSKEVLKQSPVPWYRIPFLLKRVKKELNKEIINLKPFVGINESLNSLKKNNCKLGIITSNNEENVIAFLENNNLLFCFDFIYSASNLFGKDKVIKKVIKKYKFSREKTIYVGDETRDIEAAKKSKIKVIAVAWGFNSPNILAKYKPDFLVNSPHELFSVIINNSFVKNK